MKVVIMFNLQEQQCKYIYIDEDNVFIMQNNQKQLLQTNEKERLKTLLSLFSIKEEWIKNENKDALYKILFVDKSEEIYSFNDIPDNWITFMGYVYKLVGDSL